MNVSAKMKGMFNSQICVNSTSGEYVILFYRNEEDPANDMLNECFTAYEVGCYSPKFLSPEEIEPGTIVVTEEDDMKRLEFARVQVKGSGKKVEVSFLVLI